MPIYKDFNVFTKDVDVNLLKSGDILAHDFCLRDGAVLVRAQTVLDEDIIAKLKRFGSKVVSLDITKVYVNSIYSTQALFNDARSGKVVEKNEVTELLYPLMSEITRTGNAVSILLQLRSDDEYTFQHTLNIGVISGLIAKWLGYSEEEQLKIAIAGTMHDIGKSQIPLSILNKPGRLAKEEFEIMKTHSKLSYEIVNQDSDFDEDIKLGVLQHHERFNGKGYPYGIKGEEISPYARIVSVADIYHAMTSKRVYKDKENPLYVLDEIRKEIDALDPQVVLTFIKNMCQRLCGCKISLSDGRTGTIINIDENNLRYPLVKLDDSPYVLDLNKKREITITDIYEPHLYSYR